MSDNKKEKKIENDYHFCFVAKDENNKMVVVYLNKSNGNLKISLGGSIKDAMSKSGKDMNNAQIKKLLDSGEIDISLSDGSDRKFTVVKSVGCSINFIGKVEIVKLNKEELREALKKSAKMREKNNLNYFFDNLKEDPSIKDPSIKNPNRFN